MVYALGKRVQDLFPCVLLFIIQVFEWFRLVCPVVVGTTLHDWLKNLATLFHPIRSKTKTNRHSLALVFLRFPPASRNHFEF